jgi:prepilin-type N-terminal cleavage/methylation domain-containing protein
MSMHLRLCDCQTGKSGVRFAFVKSNSQLPMKNPSIRRQSGFTLVELLVVIAIIAVLAGAGFAAGNAAIQKAKRVTAQASATALETAVNNFFTEYGSLPTSNASAAALSTDSGEGVALLKVLVGASDATSLSLNPRSIKFLSVKEGKANRNGIIYNSTNVPTGLYDPWGGPYKIVLDHDYDEVVEATVGGAKSTLNGRKVAVWSEGADYKSDKKTADDVKTW